MDKLQLKVKSYKRAAEEAVSTSDQTENIIECSKVHLDLTGHTNTVAFPRVVSVRYL